MRCQRRAESVRANERSSEFVVRGLRFPIIERHTSRFRELQIPRFARDDKQGKGRDEFQRSLGCCANSALRFSPQFARFGQQRH